MSGRPARWIRCAATASLVAGVLSSAPAPAEARPAAAPAHPHARQLPAAPAVPGPGQGSVATLLTELKQLYTRHRTAQTRYRGTAEKLGTQRAKVTKLKGELDDVQDRVHRSRLEIGQLARSQYQQRSDLSPYLRLLLAPDPRQALAEGHFVRRAARHRTTVLARLTLGERKAAKLSAAADKAMRRQQLLTSREKRQRDAINSQLRQVEELLVGLGPQDLAGLPGPGLATIRGSQEALLTGGALSGYRPPSAQGARALTYAVRQIGKPYVWGATGPDSFDCSGLTSAAWGEAGREIPRTSQQQWAELPHVRLGELRPGDLVVYFPGATHVALYLGGGLVVQAPRPGSRVKVSPVGSNPVLGAVRPDPGAPAMKNWQPPKLPKGARDGSDEGYQGP